MSLIVPPFAPVKHHWRTAELTGTSTLQIF